MKIPLSTCALALATLLAGAAMAGDGTQPDAGKHAPRGIMSADTNGDGKLSKDELATLQHQKKGDWFDRADSDKDGYLTTDEIRAARMAVRKHQHAQKKARLEQRFQEADNNGDGQLSLDEVQARMPRLAERFSAVDVDRDGMLSKEELRQGRQRRGGSR